MTPAPKSPTVTREAQTHHIKCWPDVFEEMRAGRKTAEFRWNDRDYRAGDTLLIREWDTATGAYTHREIERRITHVLGSGFGMPAGYAMLSLAAFNGTALEALHAQEDAEDAREACVNCAGEGMWEHCPSCSLTFGRAIDLRRAALSTPPAAVERGEVTRIVAELQAAMRYASPGPWEVDSEWNADGAYGGGPDHGTGYDDYLILDAKGQALFGSENSTAKMIEEEHDEDGGTAWDQAARRNAHLIVTVVNHLPAILSALSQDLRP